jgi:hypothetical protein
MHLLLPICGKFTRALLAHQIFLLKNIREVQNGRAQKGDVLEKNVFVTFS